MSEILHTFLGYGIPYISVKRIQFSWYGPDRTSFLPGVMWAKEMCWCWTSEFLGACCEIIGFRDVGFRGVKGFRVLGFAVRGLGI